ncbi:MAG: hypothetical protein RI911_325 [Candidatus Parcubacteria bacterium]|jgi:hypothetical protein
MKQTLCSLFIGISVLAVSLALPRGADAFTYCEYEDDCYFYEGENSYYGEAYYGNYVNTQTQSTYDRYCEEYYDGVDCYHYLYDRDVVQHEASEVQVVFPTYTTYAQSTPVQNYTYPVYTPVYVPTPVPVQQRVEVPVTKTVTKTVYVPSKTKKKTGFSVTYSRGY